MQKNNRILVIDDNKSIHEDFRKVLCSRAEEGHHQEVSDLEDELFGDDESEDKGTENFTIDYEVDSAYQGQEALQMIQKAEDEGRPYALAFMDVRMPPGWDGVETISRIWLKFPYIEMVLCTAYSDYTWDEIVTKLGATDKLLFLRKPFDAIAVQQMALTLIKKWNLGNQARNYVRELEVEVNERTQQLKKILAELEVKNDELLSTNEALKHVALHDSLTKLPNRALFNDRLSHSIEVAAREDSKFAVFIIDVDKFKQINDTLGHLTGDAVLFEVGERLSVTLRSSDTISRLGGDEFALILPKINDDAPEFLANKIIESLKPPVIFGEHSVDVNVSIGIAVFPDHGDNAESLLKHSDSAMYYAKQNNSGFAMFDSSEESKRLDKAKLITDLKLALDEEALHLNYQPIIDLRSNKVIGVEALARWNHSVRGLIPPDEFIPLAEKKGLIQKLSAWVFNEAIKQCSEWHKKGVHLKISINLSPRNFLDPDLPRDIKASLKKWNLDPQWVRLEITESMTMAQPEKAFEIISSLNKLGLEISIDDFGTGYSSLSYLRKLPVNEIKIDRIFVMDMETDENNKIIVKSTINLAHDLGMAVVAEGVESNQTLEMLSDMGCDRAQGYHMCKPQSASEISEWLTNSDWQVEEKKRAQG